MSTSELSAKQLLHCSPEELELYLPDTLDAKWLGEYVREQQKIAKEELAEEIAEGIEVLLHTNRDMLPQYDPSVIDVAEYLLLIPNSRVLKLAKLLKDLGVD